MSIQDVIIKGELHGDKRYEGRFIIQYVLYFVKHHNTDEKAAPCCSCQKVLFY